MPPGSAGVLWWSGSDRRSCGLSWASGGGETLPHQRIEINVMLDIVLLRAVWSCAGGGNCSRAGRTALRVYTSVDGCYEGTNQDPRTDSSNDGALHEDRNTRVMLQLRNSLTHANCGGPCRSPCVIVKVFALRIVVRMAVFLGPGIATIHVSRNSAKCGSVRVVTKSRIDALVNLLNGWRSCV